MEFKELDLPGVFLIKQTPWRDERGALRRHFCAQEYARRGLNPAVVQSNLSTNTHKGTLRGFHYQVEPHRECKTLSCLSGAIWDIVLDMRPESLMFKKWLSVELRAGDDCSLYLPAGCANAFLTLEDNTTAHYFMSEYFNPESYRGIRFDDPAFCFVWPARPLVVSEKDAGFPDWKPQRPAS